MKDIEEIIENKEEEIIAQTDSNEPDETDTVDIDETLQDDDKIINDDGSTNDVDIIESDEKAKILQEETMVEIEEEPKDIKELINSFKPLDYFDFVNLHIHSKYSDGKADFEDIIRQANELGYQKIAIADHNTIEGHKKYKDKVLIPAVEFDCWCGYVFMHLLAYGIDIENPVLDEFMAKTKKETEADIVRIFAKRDVQKLINAIHEAGGVAVLAHPACCWALNLDKFVGKLVSFGLDGIEVYYPYRRHRAIIRFATLRQIKDIAAKYNLMVTGGTDCHTRNILSY